MRADFPGGGALVRPSRTRCAIRQDMRLGYRIPEGAAARPLPFVIVHAFGELGSNQPGPKTATRSSGDWQKNELPR